MTTDGPLRFGMNQPFPQDHFVLSLVGSRVSLVGDRSRLVTPALSTASMSISSTGLQTPCTPTHHKT
eukprot:6486456-Amphidinium_carterae.1